MLSKANRLSLKTDRFRVERERKTYHSLFFTYLIAARPSSSLPSRYTILIGKKYLPLATDRHHLKRQITEILRLHLSDFSLGQDVILIPKRQLLSASPEQILADLIEKLTKK